jgi:hypothetical protein
MCDRSAHKEYKTDTTLVLVSLKSLRGATLQGRRDEAKNELASPPVVSQPPRNRARRGRERQDCLAPTSTLATISVPRWSKREAKIQPCHKCCTPPYTAATPSFPSSLTNPLLALVVGRGSTGFRPPQTISSRSHAWSLTVPLQIPLSSLSFELSL